MKVPRAVNKEQIVSFLIKRFGDKFTENKILADYTTFKVGGPARFFVDCDNVQDIVDAVNFAADVDLRYFILGGGSNLLISDNGYNGLIIHVRNLELEIKDNLVTVAAGYEWEKLVDLCCRKGLGGMEAMAGIKGTVGGAVYGNAGAFGKSVADILLEAEILKPAGQPRWEANKYFAFSYRNSILKRSREVVLRIRFQLEPDDPEKLLAKQEEIMALRSQKHPTWDCSAGCFFKNIEKPDEPYGKLAAGMLLEKVGAKQMSIGGAKVSDKHANILLNAGSARASDLRKLSQLLKEKVREKFGYILEEEITFLGD